MFALCQIVTVNQPLSRHSRATRTPLSHRPRTTITLKIYTPLYIVKKEAHPFKDTHPPTHAPKENYTRIIVPVKAKNLHKRCYSWDSCQINTLFQNNPCR